MPLEGKRSKSAALWKGGLLLLELLFYCLVLVAIGLAALGVLLLLVMFIIMPVFYVLLFIAAALVMILAAWFAIALVAWAVCRDKSAFTKVVKPLTIADNWLWKNRHRAKLPPGTGKKLGKGLEWAWNKANTFVIRPICNRIVSTSRLIWPPDKKE